MISTHRRSVFSSIRVDVNVISVREKACCHKHKSQKLHDIPLFGLGKTRFAWSAPPPATFSSSYMDKFWPADHPSLDFIRFSDTLRILTERLARALTPRYKEFSMKKAVLLDRDGTLIVDRIYLNDPNQIEYLPGVFEALRLLRDAGYVFAVATNQSGVPRGIVDVRNLDEIHRIIQADFCRYGVDILSFHSAPYMTDNDHKFRKPNPGMLEEACSWHRIDARKSWMVGDRETDVIAGHRAGMRGALLAPTSNWPHDERPPEITKTSLLEVARSILEMESES
jgi:D-glycero-D-manno-heptose 1,7-bisphosphate phosphatase